MVTVLRESRIRVVIYRNDHEPPHVHVYGGGSAKIELGGENEDPEIVDAEEMKFGDLRKAKRIVAAHKAELMAKWIEFHG
ncbi:MAG: hypothetical protein QOJ27_1939 [Sphingomonadales bacterium]|nr:hypothetical protein [Sphingomonadales bacterium]